MSAQGGGPEFSLIVPVYNVAPFLPDFLTSLDEQIDAPAYELIFVDDGSTDDSPAHLLRYAADHLGTRVVRQANQGLSEARNTGLRHATGTWVSFPIPMIDSRRDIWRRCATSWLTTPSTWT